MGEWQLQQGRECIRVWGGRGSPLQQTGVGVGAGAGQIVGGATVKGRGYHASNESQAR